MGHEARRKADILSRLASDHLALTRLFDGLSGQHVEVVEHTAAMALSALHMTQTAAEMVETLLGALDGDVDLTADERAAMREAARQAHCLAGGKVATLEQWRDTARRLRG